MLVRDSADTSGYGGPAAGEVWRDAVTGLHGVFGFRFPDDCAYRGSLSWQSDEVFGLVRWESDAEELERTQRMIRRAQTDTIEALVPLTGALDVDQGGWCGTVVPGELVVVPIDEPLRLRHGDSTQAASLVMPRAYLEARLGARFAAARRLDARAGLTRVLRQMIIDLHTQRASLNVADFALGCDRAVDLLAAVTRGPTDPTTFPAEAADAARAVVRLHADDLTLTCAELARRTGWSLRQLEIVLAREGTTPSALLRAERLERARVRLGSPTHRHETIESIAGRAGFSSGSAFSAAFKARFGHTPSDAR